MQYMDEYLCEIHNHVSRRLKHVDRFKLSKGGISFSIKFFDPFQRLKVYVIILILIYSALLF